MIHIQGYNYSHTEVFLKLFSSRVIDHNMTGYGNPPKSLWRRYNEFELLRYYLEVMYPHIMIPPLPEKKVSWFGLILMFQHLFHPNNISGITNLNIILLLLMCLVSGSQTFLWVTILLHYIIKNRHLK